MILGALVDAGLSIDGLRDSLRKLNAKGYEISSMKACRGGINGTLVSVDQDSIGRKRRGAADFIDVIRSSNLSESVVEKLSLIHISEPTRPY